MASTAIGVSRFHGQVRACTCGIAKYPETAQERACAFCLNRGFVAECLACDGKGRKTEKMAGGPGTMSSTCNSCGGVGTYPVRKPDDWKDEEQKAEPQEETAEV